MTQKTVPTVCKLTFFNDPKILILALYDLFEIAEVLAQVVHFAIVKLDSIGGALFDIEAGADVDDDGVLGGEGAGDVQGLR
jgi:hypothetical protein